ncbi:selenocysteine-specific translation elongation factor [Paracoccus sp. S-4012]|uniref:selenocysteine-specific translation elongation factor n=1 Tax=Paracoccus sp. S-4012 TaxID=2665648 RepID=UPI0013232851|nr:selenocysteine-specific translation elongation factor [Paracoccus sp. S-4012]
MIVGTAGHIDHGKTALVKALTGADVDRLKEEKARGITIELGFAYADLGTGVVGFVDVPGHEKLVHTMVAGAGGIDLALIVVAADDGVMPQTREHVAILDLLGVPRAIVALTKADLADEARRGAVAAEVAAVLAGTALEGAEVVAVSSLTGEGIAGLRDRLARAAAETRARAAEGGFRLAVDRSFSMTGAGTVVTGTVHSGRIATGDEVVVSPSGLTARVRELRAESRSAASAGSGHRVALNLAGPGIAKDAIHRGDEIVAPALHAPTSRIDAELRLLASEARPLTSGSRARLHSGTVEAGVRIVALGADAVPGGAAAMVQLVLDRPIATSWGRRFILRDVSAQRTLGGGRFIDLRPPARKRATPERLAQLEAMSVSDPAEALAAQLAAPPRMVAWDAFLRDRNLDPGALDGQAVVLGAAPDRVALAPPTAETLRADMTATLAAFHVEHSDLQGMAPERLRLALNPRLPKPAFAALLAAEAARGEFRLDSGFARLPSHEVRMTPEDQGIYQRYIAGLGGEGRFRPPRVRDFATVEGEDEREVRRVMRLAARMGRVDQISRDHFFLRPTTEEMADIVRRLSAAAPDGWFSAPALRDELRNGRKVAIEILDFFDRHGLTLRRGDLRRVNPHRADLFGGGNRGEGA